MMEVIIVKIKVINKLPPDKSRIETGETQADPRQTHQTDDDTGGRTGHGRLNDAAGRTVKNEHDVFRRKVFGRLMSPTNTAAIMANSPARLVDAPLANMKMMTNSGTR